jgi:hypothetical protein
MAAYRLAVWVFSLAACNVFAENISINRSIFGSSEEAEVYDAQLGKVLVVRKVGMFGTESYSFYISAPSHNLSDAELHPIKARLIAQHRRIINEQCAVKESNKKYKYQRKIAKQQRAACVHSRCIGRLGMHKI